MLTLQPARIDRENTALADLQRHQTIAAGRYGPTSAKAHRWVETVTTQALRAFVEGRR